MKFHIQIGKGAQSYFFNFLKNFWRFWYHHKKAHIFLSTHVKFHSQNMFHKEDIDEKVPGYGNHNKHRALQITKLLHTSNRLDRFNSKFAFVTLE